MTSIAVFDPGMTTGLVTAWFTDDKPVLIEMKKEIPGGLAEADKWAGHVGAYGFDVVVCEKFRVTPRVFRAVELEAMRIEGSVHAWNKPVVWQYNDQLLLAGSGHGSASRNKTAADNVLRHLGLWTLPSEIPNHPDANDINSAMKHLIAYLRNIDHKPTLEALEEYAMS